MKSLIEVFPQWASGGGIFGKIADAMGDGLPWSDDLNAERLDIAYFGGHSGSKPISPIVSNIMSDSVLTENERLLLAQIAIDAWGVNWARMWNTLKAQYEPLENYNMTERGSDTDTIQHGHVETRTPDIDRSREDTETVTPRVGRTTTNEIQGFNSIDYSPANRENISQTGEDITRTVSTDTESGTETIEHSGRDIDNKTHEITRTGNIGVTTSQQMLQSEREVWQWNFTQWLFKTLDSVLALDIYDCRREFV